jgi:hypothetical protein
VRLTSYQRCKDAEAAELRTIKRRLEHYTRHARSLSSGLAIRMSTARAIPAIQQIQHATR